MPDHPPIIHSLIKHGVSVHLELRMNDKGTKFVAYIVGGFYKSGTVWLEPTFFDGETPGSGFVAHARYGDFMTIRTLKDLVLMNYRWWLRSRKRLGNKVAADPSWLRLYRSFDLVEERTHVEIIPKRTS